MAILRGGSTSGGSLILTVDTIKEVVNILQGSYTSGALFTLFSDLIGTIGKTIRVNGTLYDGSRGLAIAAANYYNLTTVYLYYGDGAYGENSLKALASGNATSYNINLAY